MTAATARLYGLPEWKQRRSVELGGDVSSARRQTVELRVRQPG